MSTYIVRDLETGADSFAIEAPDHETAVREAWGHELTTFEAVCIPQHEHPDWQGYLDYCRWAPGPLRSFVGYLNHHRAQVRRCEENRRTGSTRDQPTLEDIRVSALAVVEV